MLIVFITFGIGDRLHLAIPEEVVSCRGTVHVSEAEDDFVRECFLTAYWRRWGTCGWSLRAASFLARTH